MSLPVTASSPEANYASRDNIVHPASNYGTTTGENIVKAAEARAQQELTDRIGGSLVTVTVATGAIKRGK